MGYADVTKSSSIAATSVAQAQSASDKAQAAIDTANSLTSVAPKNKAEQIEQQAAVAKAQAAIEAYNTAAANASEWSTFSASSFGVNNIDQSKIYAPIGLGSPENVQGIQKTVVSSTPVYDANGKLTGYNVLYSDGSREFQPATAANANLGAQKMDAIAAISALLSSYGIGDLSLAITDAVVKGYSSDTIQLMMQDPNGTDPLAVAFQKRFPANKARLAAGKSVLSAAEYLQAERSYTQVLQSYGVSNLATRDKLNSFITNDISATEVADRVGLAIDRVKNADADTKAALALYYPMLNQGDIVGAVLDPAEGLPALQRKVQMAEIGGAALAQGLKTTNAAGQLQSIDIKMGQDALANLGITKKQAQEGFATVAEVAPTGTFLSDISASGQKYGQLQAEQETFQGLASAKRARTFLTAEEKARFGGASGTTKGTLSSQTRGAI
jgi:hypothetical protein